MRAPSPAQCQCHPPGQKPPARRSGQRSCLEENGRDNRGACLNLGSFLASWGTGVFAWVLIGGIGNQSGAPARYLESVGGGLIGPQRTEAGQKESDEEAEDTDRRIEADGEALVIGILTSEFYMMFDRKEKNGFERNYKYKKK